MYIPLLLALFGHISYDESTLVVRGLKARFLSNRANYNTSLKYRTQPSVVYFHFQK